MCAMRQVRRNTRRTRESAGTLLATCNIGQITSPLDFFSREGAIKYELGYDQRQVESAEG